MLHIGSSDPIDTKRKEKNSRRGNSVDYSDTNIHSGLHAAWCFGVRYRSVTLTRSFFISLRVHLRENYNISHNERQHTQKISFVDRVQFIRAGSQFSRVKSGLESYQKLAVFLRHQIPIVTERNGHRVLHSNTRQTQVRQELIHIDSA